MSIKRRIFISSPADKHLDTRRRLVKRAIMDTITSLGYEVQAFGTTDFGLGLANRQNWNPVTVDAVMRHCVGAAILGFPRRTPPQEGQTVSLASEYCHYEAALARAYQLSLLSLIEEGVEDEGFFGAKSGINCTLPANAGKSWVKGRSFQDYLMQWRTELEDRRDIFLGYSTKSAATASKVKTYLEDTLKTTVLDWHDFRPSGFILDRIREAAARCSAGVFLFTKDDKLGSGRQAVPRDNVVFETGYFMHAKGASHVLVILEQGARIPADLGGKIFADLADRNNIASVEPTIQSFVAGL